MKVDLAVGGLRVPLRVRQMRSDETIGDFRCSHV